MLGWDYENYISTLPLDFLQGRGGRKDALLSWQVVINYSIQLGGALLEPASHV